jgi:hypothetical protein
MVGLSPDFLVSLPVTLAVSQSSRNHKSKIAYYLYLYSASSDGTYWSASDFSLYNDKLLILNYVDNADSQIHLLDIETGELRLLAGDPDKPSSNFPFAFDREGTGFWYITDVNGDFRQMAWQSLEKGSKPVMFTSKLQSCSCRNTL